MAVLPDYVSGTITLANGSTTVTGTGTMFQAAAFKAGDTLQIQNLTAVIASVNSNTSLTLTAPWTGTSLTNATYRARYLPDGARVTAQTTTLIELLGNGVLTNLAELGVEDGKVPVGNASGEYELADLVTDPNGTLAKFAALTLAANKALATDSSGNAQQIDLGTLGRALLALAAGTTAQYVQGDGTLQAKAGLPISTATQSALNNKLSTVNGQPNTVRTFNIDNFDDKSGIYIKSSRPNGASGQTNFSGPIDFAIGSSQIRGSVSLFERIGTESVLSFNVGYYNSQQWFEMTNAGAFRVPGALTAGSKSFKIDHPKDPYNKFLVYMSTEAPKAGIEDWGTVRLVNGQAEVDLDIAAGHMSGTFVALTQRAIVVSVNNLDSHTRVRAGRITDGKFTIFADDHDCNDEVTWQVKAERADLFIKSHPYCDPVTGLLIPEHEKED